MSRNAVLTLLGLLVFCANTLTLAKAEDSTSCEANLMLEVLKESPDHKYQYTIEHEALKTAARYIKGITGEYGTLVAIEQNLIYANGWISIGLQFKDHLKREIPLGVVVDPKTMKSKILVSFIADNGPNKPLGRVYTLKNSVTIDGSYKLDDLQKLIDAGK